MPISTPGRWDNEAGPHSAPGLSHIASCRCMHSQQLCHGWRACRRLRRRAFCDGHGRGRLARLNEAAVAKNPLHGLGLLVAAAAKSRAHTDSKALDDTCMPFWHVGSIVHFCQQFAVQALELSRRIDAGCIAGANEWLQRLSNRVCTGVIGCEGSDTAGIAVDFQRASHKETDACAIDEMQHEPLPFHDRCGETGVLAPVLAFDTCAPLGGGGGGGV